MTGPHLTPEHVEEARAVTNFWLRTLEDCDCPPETYPTGDTRTLHDPFCSSMLRSAASAFLATEAALDAERAAHAQTRTALTDSTALLTNLLVSSSHLPWRDLEAQIVANQVALGLAVAEADKP